MLSTVAAVGSKPVTPSSWKLDSSSTQASGSTSKVGAAGGGGASSIRGASASSLNRLGVLPDVEVQSQIISTEPGELESF